MARFDNRGFPDMSGNFCPDSIIELSRESVIVKYCFDMWRGGRVTWEQALIMMVLHLAEQNKRWEETAHKAMNYSSAPPVMVVDKSIFDGKIKPQEGINGD